MFPTYNGKKFALKSSTAIQAEVALKTMFMFSPRITQCPEATVLDAEHTLTHITFFIFQQTVVCKELVCSVLML